MRKGRPPALLSDGVHTYSYDAENRILDVDGNPDLYAYDADGLRIFHHNSGGWSEPLYDLAGRKVLDQPQGRTEIYAAGRHLATYGSATTYFNHADWLGTARARSNVSGSVCETITSLPFGDAQTTSGTCGDPSPQHFTDKERDTESGLDNFGARYDSSQYGRFMTPDRSPMGIAMADPQSWNLYSYVRNRPTGSVDAGGNWATPVHVEITTFALQGYMSAGDLQHLVNRQYVMDADQSLEHQYRHAMRSPNQSAQEASGDMWNFVADSINGANATLTPGGGFTSISLDWLGDATHTVQDYTSREHTSPSGEPMVWPGTAPNHWGHDVMHWAGESSANRDWYAIGMAVRLTMATFMQANPELAAQHGLTDKTFESQFDKRMSQYMDWFYSASPNYGSQWQQEAARQCGFGNRAAC